MFKKFNLPKTLDFAQALVAPITGTIASVLIGGAVFGINYPAVSECMSRTNGGSPDPEKMISLDVFNILHQTVQAGNIDCSDTTQLLVRSAVSAIAFVAVCAMTADSIKNIKRTVFLNKVSREMKSIVKEDPADAWTMAGIILKSRTVAKDLSAAVQRCSEEYSKRFNLPEDKAREAVLGRMDRALGRQNILWQSQLYSTLAKNFPSCLSISARKMCKQAQLLTA